MREARRRTVLAMALAAIAIAATLALAACGGSDPAGWGAPEPVPDARAAHMSVAFAGDGRALAVWTDDRGGEPRLMFAERPPGVGWSRPEPILEGRRWSILGPQLAVNARGDAAVTFSLAARASTVLMGSYRPAGGAWEAPQALAPAARGERGPVAAVGEHAEVVLAWYEFGLDGGLRFSRREAGGGWRDPGRIAIGGVPFSAKLALAPDGRAYLLTVGVAGLGADRPHLLVSDSGGGWTLLPTLPDAPGREHPVGLAVDGAGRPIVAWFRPGRRPGSGALVVGRLGADGRWSTPRVLDRAHGSWFGTVEAAATDEGVALAWARWSQPRRVVSVRAALLQEGRLVAPPTEIDAFDVPGARGAAVASRPPETTLRLAGGARPALLWDRQVTPRPRHAARLMTSRREGAAWTAPEPVTDEALAALPAGIHSGGGQNVVLWREMPPSLGGPARIVAAERASDGSE